MTHTTPCLADLRRPRLLIRAARHGLHDYRRDRDLRRLIAPEAAHSSERAVAELMAAEHESEAERQRGEDGYSLTRHIELLIALMAEAQLLARVA
jgi:hypothetical protein